MRHLPAAATPRLRERLAATPDGPLTVVHRGPHALYLALPAFTGDDRPWALGVLTAGAVRVPNGLRTALSDLAGIDPEGARTADGRLVLGDVEVRVTRLVDARVPPMTSGPGGQALGASRAGVSTAGVVAAGVVAAGVLAGIGGGEGLTPYGDDVACGWLAARYAAGLPLPEADVRRAARRTTLLSESLLECALHGEVVPEFAAWLASRGPDDEAALLQVGATSGRGLLEGARLALGATEAAA